jgi:hypothetical protein
VTFAVYGITSYRRYSQYDLLFVPDVTIVNPSQRRSVSLGVELLIEMGRGGEAVCPPESRPVEDWERSQNLYGKSHLKFPLNLGPSNTVSGYIAFHSNVLRGVRVDRRVDNSGVPYLAGRIQFIDFLSTPPK